MEFWHCNLYITLLSPSPARSTFTPSPLRWLHIRRSTRLPQASSHHHSNVYVSNHNHSYVYPAISTSPAFSNTIIIVYLSTLQPWLKPRRYSSTGYQCMCTCTVCFSQFFSQDVERSFQIHCVHLTKLSRVHLCGIFSVSAFHFLSTKA